MAVSITWEAAYAACASKEFARQLAAPGAYPSAEACIAAAQRIWWNEVGVDGWLEAFAAHPEIGDAAALQKKFADQAQQAFSQLSQGEQAAALATSNPEVFEELAALNKAYKARHGFIFIICASGKSAAEILEALKARLPNPPYTELAAAAREQMKITQLRLEKLLSTSSSRGNSPAERAQVRTEQIAAHLAPQATAGAADTAGHASSSQLRSPITTHVLDTALGVPATGLPISLHREMDGSAGMYDCLASGVTDADGRIGNLLAPSGWVAPGKYRMKFDTGAYLKACRERHPGVFKAVPFYPEAVVDFTITPDMCAQHFHIPLLLNPYGYSTYRGS